MNLQQHKEAWEDFREWFNAIFPCMGFDIDNQDAMAFLDLPFEMQLGVYLKYFDKKEISVFNIWFKQYEAFKTDIPNVRWETGYDFESGIEQAFELRNEQLNK